MTAIFGEKLTFPQENGPNVKLVVYGDEFYARYETEEGYTVVYDKELGIFCYSLVVDGEFVSSGIDLNKEPPPGLEKHLEESLKMRLSKSKKKFK